MWKLSKKSNGPRLFSLTRSTWLAIFRARTAIIDMTIAKTSWMRANWRRGIRIFDVSTAIIENLESICATLFTVSVSGVMGGPKRKGRRPDLGSAGNVIPGVSQLPPRSISRVANQGCGYGGRR